MRHSIATLVIRLLSLLRGETGVGAMVSTLWTNLLIMAINLGTGVLTARMLGPEGRGELAAMTLWPQLLGYMVVLGLPTALVYQAKCQPELQRELMGAALVLSVAMGGISVLFGWWLIPIWLQHYSPEIVHFAQWMMFVAPLEVTGLVFMAGMQVMSHFTDYNRLRYFTPAFTLLALLLLVVSGNLSPFTATLAYLLAAFPVFLWGLRWTWISFRPVLSSFRSSSEALLSYAWRSAGSSLATVLAPQLDRVLVLGLLSPAAMGLYVVAVSLARTLSSLISPISNVLLPKTAGRAPDEILAVTGRTVRATLALTGAVALPLGLLAPWVLELLYGPGFVEATQVFRILLLDAIFASAGMVLAQAFLAVGKPGFVSILQGVSLILTVILVMLLTPRFGLTGVASAMLISTILRLLMINLSVPRIFNVAPPQLLPVWSELVDVMRLVRNTGRT
ncbi:oligosaccharide flippase family protein [Thermithiobacillus plumbiphilus]|uniref:Oligosaccharide flippase family protein n=1 Tax=Thermithiobacillus plumbiphilus TaxID=1729899 RepID=A0ABU9DCB9_9PROT